VDLIKSFREEFRLTHQDFAAAWRREANYLAEESRPAETTLDVMTLIAAALR